MKMRRMTLMLLLLPALVCCCAAPRGGQTPFERMDRNDDGRLTRSEFRGRPPAFDKMDGNRDGYLTLQEAAGTPLAGGASPGRRTESPAPAKPSAQLKYIDTHNHLVSRRVRGQFNFERPIRIALESMDAAGVKRNLLLPMPQAPGQKLKLRFEDLQPVVRKYPDRFAALGGGGSLNVLIMQAAKEGRVTSAMEKEFDARAAELARKGAVGFGEMTAEHFSMDENHPYESVSPDHPLFLRLADLAALHGIPIDLHMEAIPEAMPMPPRFNSPPNPKVLKPNIEALGRLLAHNRKARIIWVHLGWDNTARRTVALTRQLLAPHPNLYMSIRIASGMQKRRVVAPGFPLDGEGRLRPEWLALFREFPDRFVLGSDEIIKPAGDHPSAGSIASTVGLLKQLPSDLQTRIGYENACRLYGLSR